MKKAHVVTGIVLVLAALGTQACTLGSDTYITAEKDDTEPADTSDAGPKTDASSSQNLNSGAAASCSGGSYTAPDVSKLPGSSRMLPVIVRFSSSGVTPLVVRKSRICVRIAVIESPVRSVCTGA